MRERTELLIRGMTENRTKRHRWLAMVTALAFLTGGNVFWSLREIGTAVTEDDLCTREAHEHSEECYDENGDLICGKEEHVHTAACFSDENADVETAEIWEATIPEREGLSRQEQAALIAESQLGYAESTNNFILGEDGVQHGYTRYGAWYGNPYGEWNTMFTYFCLYYAGVSAEEIPCIGNARTWQVKLSECGLIRGPDTEPERGEVILLDLDADGEADLTGIITDAAETLHFVEGDLGHAVAEGELALDAEQILGYVAIPEPDTPDAENPEASPPDESPPEDADESSPDAEPAPTEEQPAASESEQPLVTYRAEAPSGIQVSAVAAEGVFPADTVMIVTDVPREEALQAAAEGLSADAGELDAVAVDISFYSADGTELEPAGGVDVQIILPEAQQLAGENYTLLHVADDGAVQTVEAEITDDAVTFMAEQFSMYVVYTWQESYLPPNDTAKEINDATVYMNGGTSNSATNPYIIQVGQALNVYADAYVSGCRFYVLGNDVGSNHILNREVSDYEDTSVSPPVYRAGYRGASPGLCRVVFNNDNTYTDFYVKVIEPSKIYVNTALGEIDKDRVHEYLARANSEIANNDLFIIRDSNGNPQYVRNQMGKYSYRIYNGQTVELVTYVPQTEYTSDMDFKIAARGDHTSTDKIQQVGTTQVALIGDTYRISAVFQALDVSYGHRTGVKFGDTYFYIVVCGNDTLNHSDIEIADGGKYYTSKLVTYPDGTQQRIQIEYNAYVSGINYCNILDESQNVTQTYNKSDYWFDPQFSPGDSQYEYTSKYKVVDGVEYPSTKQFHLSQVYTADFDIEVKLVPQKELVTQINSDNTETTLPVKDISDQNPIIIPSTIVHMSHQSVIDAFNKCPDHTGLDFTLKDVDFLASAIIDAQKWVDTGTLPEGAFTFELMKPTYSYMWSTQEGDVSLTPQAGHVYMAYQMNLPDDHAWGNGVDGWTFLNAINTAYPSVIYNNAQKVGDVIAEYADPNHSGPYSIDMDAFNSILSPYLLDANAYQFDESGTAKVQGRGVCLIADYQMVSTTTNDSAGHIRFPEQVFGETGTYHFLVRESAVGDGYLFDTHLVPAVVTVTENSTTGQLSASIDYCNADKNFRNTVTYRLPDTGGSGTLPWYLGGTVLLAASALLFMKKRREGS